MPWLNFIFCIFAIVVLSYAQCETTIMIKIDNETTVNLESYIADLRVAVASTQYTASVNARMVDHLEERLKQGEIKCDCKVENPPGNIYYDIYYIRPLSWNDAREACKSLNETLPVIANERTIQMLSAKLQAARRWSSHINDTGSAFIGIHNLFDASHWVSVTGESVPSRFITSSSKTEKCAVVTLDATLKAAECNKPHAYFCGRRE